MTVCGGQGPTGYCCTRDRGHTGDHSASDGRRVLDTWTDTEHREFQRARKTPTPEIQIRRYGGWRHPYPGEVGQMLAEGHQVTIRKALP